ARQYPYAAALLVNEVPSSLKHAALTIRASNQEIQAIRSELKKVPKKPKKETIYEHVFSVPERETKRTVCA
ncbi:MAG: hypothetical protein WCD79_10705, partial [Chthoniobacteraceae bacterium]